MKAGGKLGYLAYSSIMKMEAVCLFETSVNFYRTTQPYIAEYEVSFFPFLHFPILMLFSYSSSHFLTPLFILRLFPFLLLFVLFPSSVALFLFFYFIVSFSFYTFPSFLFSFPLFFSSSSFLLILFSFLLLFLLFLLLQSPFLSYFLSFFHFIVSFSSSFISFRSFIFSPSISSPSQYPLQPPVSPTT